MNVLFRPLVWNLRRCSTASTVVFPGLGFNWDVERHRGRLEERWNSYHAPNPLLRDWYSIVDQAGCNPQGVVQDLNTVKERLISTDLSPEDLIDSLEILMLGKINYLNQRESSPEDESRILKEMENYLKKVSAYYCFRNTINRCTKMDMLKIGYLWSFIDNRKSSDSFHYSLSLKLCSKESMTTIRNFRNISIPDYMILLEMLSHLRKVSKDFHTYYLVYKFYDFYDLMAPSQILEAVWRFHILKIRLSLQNELCSILRGKILTFYENHMSIMSSNSVNVGLSVIYPFSQEFPELSQKLGHSSSLYNNPSSALSVLTAILPLKSESLTEVTCKKLGEESTLTCWGNVHNLSILLVLGLIPKPYREVLKNKIISSLTNILKKAATEWPRECRKKEFVNACYNLSIDGKLDSTFLESFYSCKFFFSNKTREPLKEFVFSNRLYKRELSFKIAIIDDMQRIVHGHQIKASLDKHRKRLLYGFKILSERNSENESVEFMEYRERFLNLKKVLVDSLGGDKTLIRETSVLPHFRLTQLIWTLSRDGSPLKIHEEFDKYELSDIKYIINAEEGCTWYALCIGTEEHKATISSTLIPKEKNPFAACMTSLGYSTLFVDLQNNQELELGIKKINSVFHSK